MTRRELYIIANRRIAAVWRKYTRETTIPNELAEAIEKTVLETYDAGRDDPRGWPDEETTREYLIPPKEVA